jgi:O-antigen/teichoic acid export membrane protein
MKPAPPFTSEQTVFGHGIYLVAVALGLFLAPGLVRVLLPFSPEVDWWNRILALPVLNLGILCIGVAWIRSRRLMKLTAATRLLVMASIGILVALHAAPPIALGVGIIDLVSAALTVWALVAERERRIAPPR